MEILLLNISLLVLSLSYNLTWILLLYQVVLELCDFFVALSRTTNRFLMSSRETNVQTGSQETASEGSSRALPKRDKKPTSTSRFTSRNISAASKRLANFQLTEQISIIYLFSTKFVHNQLFIKGPILFISQLTQVFDWWHKTAAITSSDLICMLSLKDYFSLRF